MTSRTLATALAVGLLALAACADDEVGSGDRRRTPTPLPETTLGAEITDPSIDPSIDPDEPAPTGGTYSRPQHWLCLPDRHDACDVDLDTTRIDRDGTRTVEHVEPAVDPPIDCFYVYPTVSQAPEPNSGLEPTDAERRAVRAQFAHFASSCRLFAPMYRQITRAALTGAADGIADRGLAYRDVVEAWEHYLARYNEGRGVVLIGHSQGAGHLRELLTRRVDPTPTERRLLVSAVLLGTTVRTPVDDEVGAHLDHIEPCRSETEVGCVVSFSTYPADAPPGDTGFFAGVRDTEDERAVCTNPAALEGGRAPLDSILVAHPDRDGEVSTPWVRYVGLAEGDCVEDGDYHYLSATFTSTDSDTWPSDLGGRLTPEWGLHLIDANIALGDLVGLVAAQGEMYASEH
ncbi:MAG: DUF3089 domain-containing protein [Acidimicrobiales bacterium]|nr:DUF3089 domain-containing protein [Acidimicrobiales bacterium]